jgi:hypothetical protein
VPGQGELDLFADAEDHFFAKSEDLELRIVPGKAGAAPEIVVHAGSEEMRGKRLR